MNEEEARQLAIATVEEIYNSDNVEKAAEFSFKTERLVEELRRKHWEEENEKAGVPSSIKPVPVRISRYKTVLKRVKLKAEDEIELGVGTVHDPEPKVQQLGGGEVLITQRILVKEPCYRCGTPIKIGDTVHHKIHQNFEAKVIGFKHDLVHIEFIDGVDEPFIKAYIQPEDLTWISSPVEEPVPDKK